MFRLRKWYLDLVTPRGDAFIGYAARAQVLGMPLHHNAALLARADGSTTEFRFAAFAPNCIDGGVVWNVPPLRCAGLWQRTRPARSVSLLDSTAGTIQWHCPVPGAPAEVTIGRDTYRGLGYVEELTMTLAPWNFPFATLRWGRFITASTSVIWIDWRDGLNRTWVIHNNAFDEQARVADNAVHLSNGRLDLPVSGRRVLRDAPLTHTAFPKLPALGKLLPNGLSRARETKFLTRATLHTSGGAEEGYALHEVVTWR